jgi:ubiquitin carboxyl-terminal hydrolase 48
MSPPDATADQPAIIDLSEDIVEEKIVEEPGRRRSMRQSKKSGDQKPATKRRPGQKLTVKRLDTLRDIRVAIEKKTEIPILYQKVYFNGREIEDASETIESIGVTDQETLFVQELIAYDDDVDISKLVDEPTGKARKTQNGDKKATSRTEGFGGTGLLGFSAIPATEPEEAASIAAALPGTCTQCTYLNSSDLHFCEMCEHPL